MRSSRSLLKNLLARSLLALALLFAQQHAALHWLSHAVEATQAKATNGSASAEHCGECLVLGAHGAAATSGDTPLPANFSLHARAAQPPLAPTLAALRLAYRSRAPPTLI